MLFSRIKSPVISAGDLNYDHPHLIFNGIVVERVKEQKHLGLILDSSRSFEKHLNEKIIKAKKDVGIFKHLSKF